VITRIVFAGGGEVEVPLGVEQVKDALEQDGERGRLCEFDLTRDDDGGQPIRIFVNRDQVAFITDAASPQRPVAQPRDDELRDESPPQREAGKQPVTDLWGNPVRPRRRRR
jgi:hypothetical protein